jgi:hypothetical protein
MHDLAGLHDHLMLIELGEPAVGDLGEHDAVREVRKISPQPERGSSRSPMGRPTPSFPAPDLTAGAQRAALLRVAFFTSKRTRFVFAT